MIGKSKEPQYRRAAEEAMAGWARSQDLVFEAFAARSEAVANLKALEDVYVAAGERERTAEEYTLSLEYRILALSELHRTVFPTGKCSECFDEIAPCPTMRIVTGL